MPTERESYLTMSLQVALSASWSQEHGIVVVRGNHESYPAVAMHLTAGQGAELAASLIRSVLASDPDELPRRLADAAGEALAHHWRDAIPTPGSAPVGAWT